jgi:hypothetical protein
MPKSWQLDYFVKETGEREMSVCHLTSGDETIALSPPLGSFTFFSNGYAEQNGRE